MVAARSRGGTPMPRLLADVNVGGHLGAMLDICLGPYWRGLWLEMRVEILSLADLGLGPTASDAAVWAACQAHDVVLLTANRNKDGADSLESAIAEHGTADSLPVITIGDATRLMRDRAYREAAVERLIDILIDLNDHRGAGRLYIP